MREESILALFRTEALCGLDESALGFFGDFRFHSSSLKYDRERSHLQTLDTFTFTARGAQQPWRVTSFPGELSTSLLAGRFPVDASTVQISSLFRSQPVS